MRHRHSGPKVRYKTKRGNIRLRNRPIHSQSLMKKNKNKTYKRLRKEYKISRRGDDDKDGVLNYKDCRPWDMGRQHIFIKPIESKTQGRAYVEWDSPDDIFLHNWPKDVNSNMTRDLESEEDILDLAKTISHEELHNILRKEMGRSVSSGLDVISIPSIQNQDGTIVNPQTHGELATFDEAVLMVQEEVGDELTEATESMWQGVNEGLIDKRKRLEEIELREQNT